MSLHPRKARQYMDWCIEGSKIFSTCGKRQYMAVLLDGRNRVVGVGYNGGPARERHCADGGCPRLAEGSPPGSNYDNCFRGDTEIMTPTGFDTLQNVYGLGTYDFLTSKGWQEGKVEHFGQQMTYKLRLRKGKARKNVYATANHRWFVVDSHRSKRELTTLNLRPNHHYLASVYPRTGNYEPSEEGIKAGLVFGDGSCNYSQRGSGSFIHMYGPAAEELGYLFKSNPARNLPRMWKTTYPDLGESYEFLGGWFAGYFAADGCISGRTACLDSVEKENLEYVVELCSILGIPYGRITKSKRPDFNGHITEIYRLNFPQNAIPEKLFLLSHHKAVNESARRTRDFPRWVVDGIVEEKIEDVFCAVVPGFQEFALRDNILTGNCIAIHAEQNAFLNSVADARILIINGPPCYTCAKMIVNSSVELVYFLKDDASSYAKWPEVQAFMTRNKVRTIPVASE